MEDCVMDFNRHAYPIMSIKKEETLQIIVCILSCNKIVQYTWGGV